MIPRIPLLVLLLGPACTSPVAPPDPDAFGADYRILEQPDPPLLSGTVLGVTLQYGGCNAGQLFELEFRRTLPGAVVVWLRKTSPDQPCDALFTERRDFTVPVAVRDADSIRLFGPDGLELELR
jgi:hypothetical protein